MPYFSSVSMQILNSVLTTGIFQVLRCIFFLCTGIIYLQYNTIDYTVKEGLGMDNIAF